MKNSEFTRKLKKTGVNDVQQEMQFYDYCAPALVSGRYTIKTNQQVTWTKTNVNESYEKSQDFEVEGPRFAIDGAVVYSVFPPPAATGYFEAVLPSMVFTRKTLPWERTINDQLPATPPVSWLALLVFTAEEVPAGVINTTFGNVVEPGPGIFGPQQLRDVTDQQKQSVCMAVDIPTALYNKIVPSVEDLKLLSHCREVDMAYKEIRADVDEGWFSVVIANRFPEPGKRNTVCLVSLEGFGANLYGSPVPDATYNSVRLAVLASWSFTGETARDENFSTLMQNLNACSLRLPNKPAQEITEAEKLVAEAFHDGYVAMNYLTRFGEETAAWYRGPLTPVQLYEVPQVSAFSAEAAMVYDPETGLFDLSYAAAWQIGRLLALSDKEFAVALMNWRKQMRTELLAAAVRQRAAKRFDGILKTKKLTGFEDRKFITRQLEAFLTGPFAQLIAPEAGSRKRPLISTGDYTGVTRRPDLFPGVLQKNELIALLEKGPDLKNALRKLLLKKKLKK